MIELHLAFLLRLEIPQPLRRRRSRQPAVHAFILDGRGERFVEGGVALGVNELMRKFMEDDAGDFLVAETQKGIQHWIVEVSEGGIGGNTADIGIGSRLPQFAGIAVGVVLVIVAAIVDATNEYHAPL